MSSISSPRRRANSGAFTAAAALAIASVLAACGKDSTSPSTGGTTGPTLTITADSATNNQSAPAGGTITIGVHVKNPDGTPATNQTVSWGVTVGDGTLSSRQTTTDASGGATTTWTLSKKSGTNTANASVSGATVNINATGLAGALASMVKASPDSLSFVAGASTVIVVRALDAASNPVPNVPITWSTTGGSLSATTSTTGASGQATTVLTVGSTPGTYTVTAKAAGGLAVSFTVKGI